MVSILLVVSLLAGWPFTVAANTREELVGRASVLDGDTIEIHGVRIRLQGVDAPEGAQLCEENGKSWPCGREAAMALADKLEGRTVSCHPMRKDRYHRTLAICFLGREDLNAWLVTEGWALAYRAYSDTYVTEETLARRHHRGMWRGDFTPPWDWRAQHRYSSPSGQ